MLKILLVGPFPPPHGGVSVHVSTLQDLLLQSQIPCHVLNINRDSRRNNRSDRYVSIRGPLHFMGLLLGYSFKGWSLHVHINGHNVKSWLVALAAGVAGMTGRRSREAMLTIHSGLSPAYIKSTRTARFLARTSCRFYRHVIAVNPEIRESLRSLSVPADRIEILPAFLPTSAALPELPASFERWAEAHDPILSTALFFRPEYGFELLVQAISDLRRKHPRLGCVVMGDSESRPAGLEQHIFAIGDLNHEACLAVIARADVFVRPTFSDGDAISVREALALGTAVVASDVVRRPAGTTCFRTGDPSDLATKIESLLSGVNAAQPARAVSAENVMHRLLELYS